MRWSGDEEHTRKLVAACLLRDASRLAGTRARESLYRIVRTDASPRTTIPLEGPYAYQCRPEDLVATAIEEDKRILTAMHHSCAGMLAHPRWHIEPVRLEAAYILGASAPGALVPSGLPAREFLAPLRTKAGLERFALRLVDEGEFEGVKFGGGIGFDRCDARRAVGLIYADASAAAHARRRDA